MTRWTLIRKACDSDRGDGNPDALGEVCLCYWYPLCAWARHSGWAEEEAEDLIQGFFEQLLEKGFLKSADREKGKLRTFLLTCLKRHAGYIKAKAHAAKRDARKTISLDFAWAEGRYHDLQADSDSPDKLYDKRWANTLLDYAMEALSGKIASAGKITEYEILKPFLGFQTDEAESYLIAATRLEIGEAAVKSPVFRLRKRFHEIVKIQVALPLRKGLTAKDELLELMGVT